MKLNNKGFAFSTMLYGALSLIIVVLLLVFNLLKNNTDETYYYSSIIEENLNKCVEEEIALENCYSSGSANCDTTSYYACLGIKNNSVVESVRVIDLLKDKVVSSGNGLYEDSDGNLIFRGTTVNNYIQYSGDVWRIVEIEVNGSVKIAYTKYGKSLKWDVDDSSEWKVSSLNNELNNTFYATLQNNTLIEQKNWRIGRIYDEASTLDELIFQESQVLYSNSLIGLLNASDYVKASLDASCKNDVLNSTSCTSWLSSYGGWVINASSTSEEESAKAYYFKIGDKLSKKNVSDNENVIPVLYLKSTVRIVSGDGTLSNPYMLER